MVDDKNWERQHRIEDTNAQQGLNVLKNLLDNKEFWKTIRPVLSDKNTVFSQISQEKNNWIISYDFVFSEKFSTFFEDAVRSLIVKPDKFYRNDTENLSDLQRLILETLKTIQ